MITTLLSTLGFFLALIVMIMSAYVASRIETVDIQGQICIMLNSTNIGIAYTNAIIAAVFSGVIVAIFIVNMIFDAIRENKEDNRRRQNDINEVRNQI